MAASMGILPTSAPGGSPLMGRDARAEGRAAAWGRRRGAHHVLCEDTDSSGSAIKPPVGQVFPESQPQQSALGEQLGIPGGGTLTALPQNLS